MPEALSGRQEYGQRDRRLSPCPAKGRVLDLCGVSSVQVVVASSEAHGQETESVICDVDQHCLVAAEEAFAVVVEPPVTDVPGRHRRFEQYVLLDTS